MVNMGKRYCWIKRLGWLIDQLFMQNSKWSPSSTYFVFHKTEFNYFCFLYSWKWQCSLISVESSTSKSHPLLKIVLKKHHEFEQNIARLSLRVHLKKDQIGHLGHLVFAVEDVSRRYCQSWVMFMVSSVVRDWPFRTGIIFHLTMSHWN